MVEMLSLSFMQRAIAVGLVVAVICPAIGLILVLRRLSQFGDTLAHVSLAGVAAGLVTRTYPIVTGLVFTVAASLGIDALRKAYSKYSELSVAIMLSASLGLAVVLLSLAQGGGAEVMGYLFGSIMTVTAQDLYLIAGLGIGVLVILLLLYKEMLSLAFDEEMARISGLPVGLVNTIFIVLTAVTVTMTMRVVGVLLVSSLMVVPVATSLQLAQSFRGALVWAIVAGVLSVLAGLILSFYLNLMPGGTVVLAAVAILLTVLGVKRMRGIE